MREHLTAEELCELEPCELEHLLGRSWLQLAIALQEAEGLLAQMLHEDAAQEAA